MTDKEFPTLKERCEYYRSQTDYELPKNSYVLVMVDGRSFSKFIKNRYKKPFDEKFISMMNQTAEYVCKNVEGCKFAYTQSDEISFVLTDFDTPTTQAFFGNRLCKLQSIIASLATAKFNQLAIRNAMDMVPTMRMTSEILDTVPLIQFDCKCWTVPTYNDVFAWFLYRQNDAIRNSKQQAAQTWLSHKKLMKLDTDKQIELLKETNGVDWHQFPAGMKYGRFVRKVVENFYNSDLDISYERSVWKSKEAFPLNGDGKEKFNAFNAIPIKDETEQ